MIDERLTDDERAVMAAFDSVRPHPRVWRNAVDRARPRGGWQRPLTGGRLAGALALAACAGIAAAILNGHPLKHRVSTPAVAATRPGTLPTWASPSPAGYALTLITLGPPACLDATAPGTTGGRASQPLAAWVQSAPTRCTSLAAARPAPGTYVVHLDDCDTRAATDVTVLVDGAGPPVVTRVTAAEFGLALTHGAACLPPPPAG